MHFGGGGEEEGEGFEVWLLKGCGPNLCFPMAFKPST